MIEQVVEAPAEQRYGIWGRTVSSLILMLLFVLLLCSALAVLTYPFVGGARDEGRIDVGAAFSDMLIAPIRDSGVELTLAAVAAEVGVAALAVGVLQFYSPDNIDKKTDRWLEFVRVAYKRDSVAETSGMLLVFASALIVCIVGLQALILRATSVVLLFVLVLFMHAITAGLLGLMQYSNAATIVGRLNSITQVVRLTWLFPDQMRCSKDRLSGSKEQSGRLCKRVCTLVCVLLLLVALVAFAPWVVKLILWGVLSLLCSFGVTVFAGYCRWVRKWVYGVVSGLMGLACCIVAVGCVLLVVESGRGDVVPQWCAVVLLAVASVLHIAFVLTLCLSRTCVVWRKMPIEGLLGRACYKALKGARSAKLRTEDDEWGIMVDDAIKRECSQQKSEEKGDEKTCDECRSLKEILKEVGVITEKSESGSDASTGETPGPSTPSPPSVRSAAEIIAEFYVGPIRLPLKMRCRGEPDQS
ncbi:hypothetical protein [Actinomyces sp. Z5]|uniref:hypothetical protein n=1 Tax=Actinomyces sp. Z5 TaxID=2250216 RepID=UPI0011BDA034|nr:hypothetical protein [Actinomyces sp. Z5]